VIKLLSVWSFFWKVEQLVGYSLEVGWNIWTDGQTCNQTKSPSHVWRRGVKFTWDCR